MSEHAARRGERGEMNLVGLLLSMVLFAIVSWATLSVFLRSETLTQTARTRGDAQEEARRTTERVARELRNLANPTAAQPQAIDRAEPHDLVFRVVAPAGSPPAANPSNVMRVRFCLGGRSLWRMEQPAETYTGGAVPGTAACPGAGWSNAAELAGAVANGTRPVFTYNSIVPTEVTAVRLALFVDPDPGKGAAEAQMATGVFLRNQNRRPVAVARAVSGAGTGTVVLNATGSFDPEGDALSFQWERDGTPMEGATAPVHRATGIAPGTSHAFSVVVEDPAGLPAESAPVEATG